METLRLVNFLNHEETDFRWKPVNLVFGPNGGGKSSIVSAIEWVLTGSCRDLDGRGVNNEALRRLGATQEMFVQLCHDEGPYAQRLYETGKSADLMVSGVNGRAGELEAGLWRMVGIERIDPAKARDVIRLFLRAGDMTRWSDKSWHDVLGMLSAGGLRDILDDLARHLSQSGVDADLRTPIEALVGKAKDQTYAQVGQMNSRPHVVSALHKWFYAKRRDVRKELNEAKVRAVPEPEDPELAALSDPDFGARAEKLRARIREANAEVRTNQGAVSKLEAAAQTREIRAQRQKELQERLAALHEAIDTQPEAGHVAEAEKRERAAQVELRRLEKKLESLGQLDERLADAVSLVVNRFGTQLSKKSVGVLSQAAGLAGAEAAEDPKEVLAAVEAQRVAVEKARAEKVDIDRRFDVGRKAVGEIDRVNEELAKVTGQEEAAGNLEMHREALALWEGRKAEAEALLAKMEREGMRREMARRAVHESTEHLEIQWRALDILVKAMESPQVKTGGGGQLFDTIADTMRHSVSMLFGPETVLEIPDTGHFRLDGRSWETLSASERLRFGCALAAGLSKMFKFPWLIIDGVELLVGKENRVRFFQWIGEESSNFKKIIVLAAAEDKARCPHYPRSNATWRSFWVENGTAEVLYSEDGDSSS